MNRIIINDFIASKNCTHACGDESDAYTILFDTWNIAPTHVGMNRLVCIFWLPKNYCTHACGVESSEFKKEKEDVQLHPCLIEY